jgi:hypothetical protein
MKRPALGLAIAALAACDGGGGGQTASVTKTKIAASPYIEQLRALDPQQRDLTLRRAVRDTGSSCYRVEGSEESGTYENLVVWTVRCDTSNWAVFIAPAGEVQVRSCDHVRQLGLPGCEGVDQAADASSTKR